MGFAELCVLIEQFFYIAGQVPFNPLSVTLGIPFYHNMKLVCCNLPPLNL